MTDAPEAAGDATPDDDGYRLVDAADVARALGVSARTVQRLAGGGLPHVRLGRQLRFDPHAVARWVAARATGEVTDVRFR